MTDNKIHYGLQETAGNVIVWLNDVGAKLNNNTMNSKERKDLIDNIIHIAQKGLGEEAVRKINHRSVMKGTHIMLNIAAVIEDRYKEEQND